MGVDAREFPGGLLRLDSAFAYVEPPSSWPLSWVECLMPSPNILPFSFPRDCPNSGTEPRSPALQADSLPSEPPGKLCIWFIYIYVCVCVCIGILLFFMSLSQSFTVFCLNYQNKSIPWTQILQLALLRGIQQLYGTEIVGNIYITVKYINMCVPYVWASQVALVVKNLPANVGDARDAGSIPGLRRSPGGGHGNPLQYSCLENPMDRGVWRATVHGITQSWTWLKRLSTHTAPHVYMR